MIVITIGRIVGGESVVFGFVVYEDTADVFTAIERESDLLENVEPITTGQMEDMEIHWRSTFIVRGALDSAISARHIIAPFRVRA